MSKEEIKQADPKLYPDFEFTDHTPVLRIPVDERYDKRRYFRYSNHRGFGNLLFDLAVDPDQERPLTDGTVEARLVARMKELMTENEAPGEQYRRLGLE